MALTTTQLTAIDQHLRKENWLLNEDLISELTDHYIDGISERLSQGMTFDTAIQEIHTGFGGRKGLLKMEEEYQVQYYRKVGLMEWQVIRSFMHGSRWPISALLFLVIYALNAYTGQKETIESALGIGFLFVTFSVAVNIFQSVLFFYQNRNEVNRAVMQPTSSVYIIAYCLGLTLLLVNKYVFAKYELGFPISTILLLETLLETLCLVYYAAILLSVRQVLTRNRNSKLTKTS